MANEKNLIPFNERTEKERREIARKAGQASGKTRRKKKAMREAAQMLLGLQVKNPKVIDLLSDLGINKTNMNNQMALLVAALNKGLKGDIRATEFLRDTAGEGLQASQPLHEREDDPLTASIYSEVDNGIFPETTTDSDIPPDE